MEPSIGPSPRLRKDPQQERSRAMVERIIQAGQTVLNNYGYERTTTNRVADEADISPGSLYQYFPNKEAILDAVIDRYSSDFSEQIAALVGPADFADPPALIRSVLSGLLDVLEANKEYVRLVSEQLPPSQTSERTGQIERRIRDIVSAYLLFSPSRDRIDPTASAWILVRMVEHLTVQFVLESPGLSRDQLLDELVRMTVAHLSPA